MASYRDMLKDVKSRIHEVDVRQLDASRNGAGKPVVIDVREQDEVEQGIIPGAIHIPRGYLESRVEQYVPDHETPVVAYCAGGNRSAFAAETLQQMGYKNVTSLKGGFGAWKDAGLKFVVPRDLTPAQQKRYSRHVLIPEVGKEGQLKLLDSKVLIIGAGGMGSPAAYYLAAAGVGTIGIVDSDVVDESNLQRQILHNSKRIGQPKVDSAKQTLEDLNPDVKVVPYQQRLTRDNIIELFKDYDLIVDGSDNFPTRYLVNDASVLLKKTVVHGSIFRFDGQVSVFKPFVGPCYRCVFPEPPPPELAPSCDEAGTLGILPGIVGLFEANEAVKLLLGIGEPLIGRLLMIDALTDEFRTLRLKRDPKCPVCGEGAHFKDFVGYDDGSLMPTLDLRRQITRWIRRTKPDVVVAPDPTRRWTGQRYINHPDHRAAGDATLDAIIPGSDTRLVFPELLDEGLEPHHVKEIYLTGSNEPDVWVDISETIDLKIEALREHKSQVGDWAELDQTIRERAAEMARGQSFPVAEGFKYFKLGD